MSRLSEISFEPLEPYDGKLSCTVLRGERGSNAPDLPDTKAKHRSLYEYKLDLVREVTHLLLKKDKLDREIHEMEARINDLESRFENLLDIEK